MGAGVVVALALCGGPAAAQDGGLEADLGTSYALPPGGDVGESTGYVNGGLRLTGSFAPIGYGHVGGYAGLSLTADGSSWASLVAGGSLLAPISSLVSAGFSLTGEAFTVGEPSPYRAATIRFEPEVAVGRGPTALIVRGFAGVGTSEVTALRDVVRRTARGPTIVRVGVDVGSELWAWGGSLMLRHRTGRIAPSAVVEAYQAPQGTYAGGRLSLTVDLEGASVVLEGGAWETPDGPETLFRAGLEVFIGGTGRLLASAGRYAPDPLLDTPVAGSGALGLTARLARFGPAPETSYEIRTGEDGRIVRIVLRAPDATTVSFTGDLSDWRRVPMARTADGWVVELPVTAGAHHYGFLVDGEWHVPEDAPGRSEDEWGGVHATLLVPDVPEREEM